MPRDYPDLKTFLQKIGMSLGAYYNLAKGVGNPTFWTVERTAKALGVSSWDLLGVDEKLMRAWLAGQNIDVDKVAKRVEKRRKARQGFSLDQFSVEAVSSKEVIVAEKEPPAEVAASAAAVLEPTPAVAPAGRRKAESETVPRALGHRSIVTNPCHLRIRDVLNQRVLTALCQKNIWRSLASNRVLRRVRMFLDKRPWATDALFPAMAWLALARWR